MYFTGFADEAAQSLAGQLQATKALGWSNIEARSIDGVNIHDLTEERFNQVADAFDEAGIHVNCFGSTICNWAKKVTDDFDITLQEVNRAIPRMQRLGTKLIRIMSYARMDDREPYDQLQEERFRRLREVTRRFLDAGIQPVHENCMNYGGMGWPFTLELLENVPGLKLVFDTGNCVGNDDKSKPKPYPKQSSWEFYDNVKEAVAYIHIKDGYFDHDRQALVCTWPGEGDGDVKRILQDAFARGYDGGISIEPHMQVVFHDASIQADPQARFDNYVEYGRRLMTMVKRLRGE
ncbi:MAG: sugar phosphate isomerase/epimerase [Victivallales bacterium]|nr:sugar phosphate isomerase/epimerase [Victivallales bacterium]